jgi:hypothetical protein
MADPARHGDDRAGARFASRPRSRGAPASGPSRSARHGDALEAGGAVIPQPPWNAGQMERGRRRSERRARCGARAARVAAESTESAAQNRVLAQPERWAREPAM